jgi:CRISPR-associated protein Cst2
MQRKSLAEFGWTVGLPGATRTESYLHTKYVNVDGTQEKDPEKTSDSSNLGQNLFHRPASSGTYAFVCHIDLARVGYNDIAQHYPETLDEQERERRGRTLLESVLYTFLQLDGAHRNTQAPHVVDVEGVITTSENVIPAPALSALKPEYKMHIERIANSLNALHPGAIAVYPFNDISEFTAEMSQLIRCVAPYHLPEFGREKAKQ